VEQMLASASRGPTTALADPDGQPLGPTGEMTDFPGAADRPRSVAAVACLPLIEEMPGTAPRLVEALARSLESPDHDRYDAPPSKMVAMTLGLRGFRTRPLVLTWAYAARSYSLMRPPRTGRRRIRAWERSAGRWSGRGGRSWRLRWGRRPL
jgi:hypothetical protein